MTFAETKQMLEVYADFAENILAVPVIKGVKSANVNLVFEPAWDQSMMSEEARVELGFE